jgi:anti-sigma B factor antagonist
MVEYRKEDDKFICIFTGRIDTSSAMDIENDLLDNIQRAGVPIIFDFSNLEYVASAFLRTCVKVARVAGATKVKVLNASKDILHVFTMTGFDKLMDMDHEEGH